MKQFKILFSIAMLFLAISSAGAQDVTTVTMWYPDGSSAECRADIIAEGFNAIDPAVHLDIVLQANTWDATRVAVVGGGGPDIVRTPGPSFVYEMASSGLILPLDSFADEMGWRDTFFPWALDLGLVDGELYSLSDELETLIMYYNKTLFAANGWTPPETMDELIALAEEIEAAGVTVFSHGNADWRPTNEWFVGEFMTQIAGPHNVYKALTGQIPWTDESMVEAMETLDMMMERGWFGGGVDFYVTNTFDTNLAALGSGEAAMNIEGTWRFGNINDFFGEAADNDNEWDWVSVPSKTGEDLFTIGMGNTSSINASSAHPQEAAQVLTYYFSPEVQAELLAACGKGPAPVHLAEDAMTDIDPRIARAYADLSAANADDRYGYTTWTFWPPRSDVYIYEEIERVWYDEITVMEYLEGLDELFAEELAAGDIPPIPAR
ncbi:MAG: extracellular solute-binding protein [Chloroflexi bacterium]|nr:extracellular solute-binding protein [Chloroflexota bacterium]MCY4246051.1 extracellular solute-binding protein [Chloroflexota bacterium]